MIRTMICLATASVMVACASAGNVPVINSEYWKNEDFAAYRRYAWLPGEANRREATQQEDQRLCDPTPEAIEARLATMGYVRSPASEADFFVTYDCEISERIRADVIDSGSYGTDEGSSREKVTPRIELSAFEEGSIVIDLVKPATDRRVWRGVARGPVNLDATPEQFEELVERSVREILNEFPPPQRAP